MTMAVPALRGRPVVGDSLRLLPSGRDTAGPCESKWSRTDGAGLAGGQRASAQEGLPSNSPFRGGVPTGVATADVLPLSAAEVIERALQRNLGVLSADYGVDRAKGAQR